MELFRTIVPVPVSKFKIHYGSNLIMMGSCFSEYIGDKLSAAKFHLDNNPFGVVYNPLSVKNGLDRLIDNHPYSAEELEKHGDVWDSFDHHSRFSDPDKDSCLQKINKRFQESSQNLRSAHVLFLTFGTSYVYKLRSSGKVVANCHKVAASEFERERISAAEIVKEYDDLLKKLWKLNPEIKVVFTVSPVRHWKDGAHNNQLSKATLLLAIDEICQKHERASYFPSYEIVMDELRDYRFFEEDMLHPNKIAVNYIWDKLRESFMQTETMAIMKEIEKITQATKHRPFNPETETFQVFAKQNYEKLKLLVTQYKLDLSEEEKYFKSVIRKNQKPDEAE
jgi:hypothetical protein